jgi:uncharacterized repeat protein (TIGR03803 family)
MKELSSVDFVCFFRWFPWEQKRGKLSRWSGACVVLLLWAATATVAAGQNFKNLASFTDGIEPIAEVIQGTNGNFYGTTEYGGANSRGTVFGITPYGTLTTLYSFCSQTNCTDGANPWAGLVQAANGNLYGTTQFGGGNDWGTVFRITPAGKLTTLYSFCSQPNCTDGESPAAGLLQATNGNFYGTTAGPAFNGNYGTVFEITPAGNLTTLYRFGYTDGAFPYAGLIQATNGNFYGTTIYGGANGYGTVFEITSTGTLTTLYSFCSQTNCTDGAYPEAALIQGTDGNFYGTTAWGTVFEITPSGNLTTLYNFCSQPDCTDGSSPYAGLVRATDGNFYGTTAYGGAYAYGTVFEITSSGNSFGYSDGATPSAGLAQASNGKFYGTTASGGSSGNGTVFSLSVGLGPFVETIPTSGDLGSKVTILGYKLTGTTSVTFKGTPATFTVNSSGTAITTTVPSGATTGPLVVTTPSGRLTSNVTFRVKQ